MLRPTKGMGHPLSAAVARHRCALGERATAAPRGWLRPDPMIEFAELDALNSEVSVTEDCYQFRVSLRGFTPFHSGDMGYTIGPFAGAQDALESV
jgi:hypothetical protein